MEPSKFILMENLTNKILIKSKKMSLYNFYDEKSMEQCIYIYKKYTLMILNISIAINVSKNKL
jgi:hypothetical protein